MSGSRKVVNPLQPPKAHLKSTSPLSENERDGTLLNGRLHYRQFRKGYRTGLEPVLMAAAVPARAGETILEAGCGAGAGLLCLAARVAGVSGIGLEADADTVKLAAHNFLNNPFPDSRTSLSALQAVLPAIPSSLRALAPTANGRFHHVMANPPWHSAHGTPSPDERRRLALSAEDTDPQAWIRSLTRWVLPGGTLTFIISAAITDRACQTLLENGCGSLQLYPFWPKQGREAKLVLIQAIHGGKGIFRLRPGLVLHAEDGRFTDAAERVLRRGESLPES
ncbi:tRNA1(Val) (adenine(37)-N6)-methyltransferase [Gluconobacter cerinus]|uniref:N5-glutamine S-adenosyl-L-methionine-dependent methyltransferase n=1 Tax=Gluconobacter cerinus TaxID=38307 RepID=A0A1B6VNC9_9PROT|nr:SAM-dependent methyltransferase [Gluconobacter cerinus]OAJ68578.1 N5-glutamine S-adenosyl-L-methionine-dependent methyltransferase [Gluconobacter cerinus]